MKNMTAPIVSCSRLRMETDGKGVTTLVCFYGCPLRCKYCLNPFSFDSSTNRKEVSSFTLYEHLKRDELYFLATGGGVTFGGGEPLLYPEFLKEFRFHCGENWHLCAETSLNVPKENVFIASQCIDYFYVDCKDMNDLIYEKYTTKSNKQMIENLKYLLTLVGNERITVRVPLIKDYNTEQDRDKSIELLSSLGITEFDKFSYKIKENL